MYTDNILPTGVSLIYLKTKPSSFLKNLTHSGAVITESSSKYNRLRRFS